MTTDPQSEVLESRLNDFDPAVRWKALADLADRVDRGACRAAPEAFSANMHCHTFFSYNISGHSPSSLAWLAKKNGIRLMGIVDFDVLDGVDEFLNACDRLGVRGSAGMETRVFLPEFASREINSPGNSGVFYILGVGFASGQLPEGPAADILDDLRLRARQRNLGVVEGVNACLSPVCIDYDRDVLPLTPRGNATERHIVLAYLHAAERLLADPAAFWVEKLALPPDQAANVVHDSAGLQQQVRSRLMKRGGSGFTGPGLGAFPTLQQVIQLCQACGAIPCAAWLDGLSPGEQDFAGLLDLLLPQGVAALSLIPDRNWNIADREVQRVKVQKLYDVVRLAEDRDLPILAGTEMNGFGQKLVDDFDVPELAPVRQACLDGAHFIYGHTALQRALGWGTQSSWASRHLPGRRERRLFYTQAGLCIPPSHPGLDRLRSLLPSATPEEILEAFR